MAATNVDIANSALLKLGAEKITALTDTSRRAVIVNEQFNKIRKSLLRAHPWNFAMKRAFLTKVTETSSSVNSGTDTFTAAATMSAVTGDRTRITLNSGTIPTPLSESTEYFFIKVTGTTFKLATTQANAAAGTAIDITDSPVFNATFSVGSPFEYDNKFLLPSDMLRAVREESKDVDWKREGNFIVSSETAFNLLYIADITDPTLFDTSFDELFAATLAYEISYSLVQSVSLKQQMKQDLNEVLRDIRSFDAQEGNPEELETTTWLNARL